MALAGAKRGRGAGRFCAAPMRDQLIRGSLIAIALSLISWVLTYPVFVFFGVPALARVLISAVLGWQCGRIAVAYVKKKGQW